jgi:site-specific recombinase XerD
MERTVPFNKVIKKTIRDCIREARTVTKETSIFRKKYYIPYNRNHTTVYFKRIPNKLNFDMHYLFYCLRATTIMRLVRKGVNPINIQKLEGNPTLSVTQRYCYVQADDLRDAMT